MSNQNPFTGGPAMTAKEAETVSGGRVTRRYLYALKKRKRIRPTPGSGRRNVRFFSADLAAVWEGAK